MTQANHIDRRKALSIVAAAPAADTPATKFAECCPQCCPDGVRVLGFWLKSLFFLVPGRGFEPLTY